MSYGAAAEGLALVRSSTTLACSPKSLGVATHLIPKPVLGMLAAGNAFLEPSACSDPFSTILSTEHNPILVTLSHTLLGQASARLQLIYFVLLIQDQRNRGRVSKGEEGSAASWSQPKHPWGWNSSL